MPRYFWQYRVISLHCYLCQTCNPIYLKRPEEIFSDFFSLDFFRQPLRVNFQSPACIYLLKVNNRNTRTRCEICSKLTKTPERCQAVFIVKFEHISRLVLLFLLLTLNMQLPARFSVKLNNFASCPILIMRKYYPLCMPRKLTFYDVHFMRNFQLGKPKCKH